MQSVYILKNMLLKIFNFINLTIFRQLNNFDIKKHETQLQALEKDLDRYAL